MVIAKPLARRERQHQPAAGLQSIEPIVGWAGRPVGADAGLSHRADSTLRYEN
jgi:hypothetical protein